MLHLFVKCALILSVFAQNTASQLKNLQRNHNAQRLSNADIRSLASLSNIKHTDDVLDNILIPRVVGTPNHEKVFDYIKKELIKLNWNVEVDEFEDRTPNFGVLKFKNIIATLNPDAERYLVFACHYDSKYFENEIFVGATDSAVPCAMMVNLAKTMENSFTQIRNNRDLSLKLIFLDGEEAFVNWGPNDSIYGAKHLADVYDNSVRTLSTGQTVSILDKMDLFVLLDLIGHKGTKFYSCFENTQKWHLYLADIEDRLFHLNLLKKSRNHRIFVKKAFYGYIEDDHIPFLNKGVPILHMISNPFPRQWHTVKDDRSIIHMDTVENINKILRVFVAEYLNIYLPDTIEENVPEKEL